MLSLPKTLLLVTLSLVVATPAPARAGDLEDLAAMMTGSFSSAAQAAEDPDHYRDIRLEMAPIWTDRSDGVWLYVEQAAASSLDAPYRQRVYRVTQVAENLFESAVFALPDPAAAVGAWRQEEPLARWSPEDLETRQGCSVFLIRAADGSFRGGTRERDCVSNLYGAVYATSEIVIQTGQLVSWDRGFDAADQQVWGAELGGYVFVKAPGMVEDLELGPR